MKHYDWSWVCMWMAIAAACGSLFSSAGVALFHRFWYDDSPAIVVRHARLLTTMLRPGDPLKQAFEYDKRVDCHPPQGSSEISYRVWHLPSDGSESHYEWLDYARPSRAAPGKNLNTYSDPSVIPLPTLRPGRYAFQWRAVYNCANASAVQTIDGPMLPFMVVE